MNFRPIFPQFSSRLITTTPLPEYGKFQINSLFTLATETAEVHKGSQIQTFYLLSPITLGTIRQFCSDTSTGFLFQSKIFKPVAFLRRQVGHNPRLIFLEAKKLKIIYNINQNVVPLGPRDLRSAVARGKSFSSQQDSRLRQRDSNATATSSDRCRLDNFTIDLKELG